MLRKRLGGSDLASPLDAMQFLVDQGSRSFKFIGDSLADETPGRFDEGLLKHNLAATVEKLESLGVYAPPPLLLQLAMDSYKTRTTRVAARYFDRAGDAPIHQNETYFYRGYAHFQAEDFQRSAEDMRRFLSLPHRKEFDAPARSNLGNALWKLNRIDAAIAQYSRAIQLDRNYAIAYNNLAHMFAERGQNLDRALELVNTALSLDASNNQSLAEDKDTKGWILFKAGKVNEALQPIQEAASEIKDDPLVQGHLRDVQRAATAQAK